MKNTQRLLKSGPVKKDSVTEVLLGIANTSAVESFYEMPLNKCLSIKQKPIPVLNRITSPSNKKIFTRSENGVYFIGSQLPRKLSMAGTQR